MYHLTHQYVDIMMDRHIKYWKGEILAENINLWHTTKSIISAFLNLILIKRTWLLGYDGLMLMFSYLSYLMMSFVYKWEKSRSNAPQIYLKIKNEIESEWIKMKN